MYSKEEALLIKKEFWTAFASAYPRKWLLYDTKIKDVTFKFYIDNKKAQVILDIEQKDEEKRKIYFEKIESFRKEGRTIILVSHDFTPTVVDHFLTLHPAKTGSTATVVHL